jgi:hypothetical protein
MPPDCSRFYFRIRRFGFVFAVVRHRLSPSALH